jgi:hypothetical protein
VALSSSAYKYPRKGCRKKGGERKEKEISKKREKEKRRGNQERERQFLRGKEGEPKQTIKDIPKSHFNPTLGQFLYSKHMTIKKL